MEGLDGRRLMEHLSARGEVLTLASVSPGFGVLHQEVKMDLQEAVFWQGSISWGTQDPEDESSQVGGAKPRETGNLPGTRPWFMPRMLKPRSLERNSRILKDVTRDFASTEMAWQKNLRRSASTTRRRPTPCYTPTLDAMIVSCHLFDVFRQPQQKSVFSKLLFVLCAPLSISLISLQTHGPNRGWMKMSLYFLDRWVSWRRTDGFRTWRIIWRITL